MARGVQTYKHNTWSVQYIIWGDSMNSDILHGNTITQE